MRKNFLKLNDQRNVSSIFRRKVSDSRSKGFTLIELIIVIGIMGILGTIFTDILVQSLRTQNKVRILNQVKQNGQVVLNTIVNEVQKSERVICINAGNGTTASNLVLYRQGVYTRFNFLPRNVDITNNPNGYVSSYTFTAEELSDHNYVPEDSCGTDIDSLYNSRSVYLSDRDPLNGISVDYDGTNPVFKQVGYNNEAVTIRFKAFEGTALKGQTYETTVSADGILFTTTVKIRNQI